MKIIIAGSRSFTDWNRLEKEVLQILTEYKKQGHVLTKDTVEIVSGGARGADTLAEQFAGKYNLKLKIFKADWDRLGKSAGYARNVEMANYADILIAFWDCKSKGTNHMMNIMLKLNKPDHVIIIK